MTMPLLDDKTNYGNTPGNGPLRPGGVSVPGLPGGESNLPSTPSDTAKAQLPAVALMRDVWGGTTAIRRGGMAYLPKAPGEDPEDYASRLLRSVFTNITRNTIEGLTGYIYRNDPEMGDDVPEPIVRLWENIDNAGTHGDIFLRTITADAMTVGHAAILVEFPQTGGTQSRQPELTGEIRPYWIHIFKENILSWRTTIENGKLVLTQLVLLERTMVPDGAFGEKEQRQYRMLYRDGGVVGFRLLQVTEKREVIEIDSGAYPTQDEIPVAEIRTAGSKSLFESDPPFLDLAYLNIAHYQQWSDYATSIHMTCVPFLFTAGVILKDDNGNAIKVGPNASISAKDPNAKASYISHDGSAIGSAKAALDDLKTDMAMLGLAALQSSKRAAETATAKELDKSASDSALAVTARGVQDGAERALYFTARYLRLDDGGSIEINRDYETERMDPAKMQVWVNLSKDLGVPIRRVLEIFQENGEIPEGANLDDWERQIMENQAAMEAKAAAERDAQLQALRDRQPVQPQA